LFSTSYPVIKAVVELSDFNYLDLYFIIHSDIIVLALLVQLDDGIVLLLILSLLLVDVLQGIYLLNIDIQSVRGRLKDVFSSYELITKDLGLGFHSLSDILPDRLFDLARHLLKLLTQSLGLKHDGADLLVRRRQAVLDNLVELK
jgi:hypothetical protein